MTHNKKTSLLSRVIYRTAYFFAKIKYRKMKIHGIRELNEKNTVIVANHAQLNGPIIAELCLPENCYIWANGEVMSCKEVPHYAMKDFFPHKKRWTRPFYRMVSYILALILPCLTKNARVIPVYHDIRLASTMKNTVKKLSAGNNILIFPEEHKKRNNIINSISENFIDVAVLYYKRCGERLRFLPMYIAPKLNTCCFGESIVFNPESDRAEERHRIAEHLACEITRVARELPEHTVIPFENVSPKSYVSNKDITAC